MYSFSYKNYTLYKEKNDGKQEKEEEEEHKEARKKNTRHLSRNEAEHEQTNMAGFSSFVHTI